MIGKWIERDPLYGWRLKDAEPQTVEELVEAMKEADDIASTAQGAGAPTFDHAMRIKDHLKTLLSIELSKRSVETRPSIQILAGEMHPMDDQERIQQDRRNRFNFLKHLYDDNRKISAPYIQSLAAQPVYSAIGVSDDEGAQIVRFLHDQGLIKLMAMGPKVGITRQGIEHIEEALAEPNRPTRYFPAVNVQLFQGDVHNSQIQQGTVSSSQHQTISSDDRRILMQALDDLRPALEKVQDARAREDMIADVETAAAQLNRTTPSRTILKESFLSLKSVAEQVGAGLTVAKLIELAKGAGLL